MKKHPWPDNGDELIHRIEDSITSGDVDELPSLFESFKKKKLTPQQKRKLERLEIRTLWIIGESDAALRRISSYLKKYRQDLDPNEKYEAHVMQALFDAHLSHHVAAEKDLKEALNIKSEVDDGSVAALIGMGCLERDRGNWDHALDYFLQANSLSAKNPEWITRSSCAIAELLSDLDRPGITQWTSQIKQCAPVWGGWVYLKIAQILDALLKVKSGNFGKGLSELHRFAIESDQTMSSRVRIKARMTLAEALIHVGDHASAREYVLKSKEIIDCGGKTGLSYLQFYNELMWFKSQEDTQSELILWEALDRLEIILAVVAKYPKPPGAAPYWLYLGHLQRKLKLYEQARRAFARAQSAAAEAGSRRMEALSSHALAELEFELLTDEQRNKSAEINKILSYVSKSLEAAVAIEDLDLEWRSHGLRGKIYKRIGEQYLAGEELEVAARQLTGILADLEDPALKKNFLEHKDRKKFIDELKPYLDQINLHDLPVKLDKTDQISVQVEAGDEQDIQRLQMLLESLTSLHASQSRDALLINFANALLRILFADRVFLKLVPDAKSTEFVFSKTKMNSSQGHLFEIPIEWERQVQISTQYLRFQRMADADDMETRAVLLVPMMFRKQRRGFVYLDRPLRQGEFTEEETQLVETMIDASSIAISNLLLRSKLAEITDEFRKEIVPHFPDLIGQSDQIKEVFILMQKLAVSDIPALIYGETGTGKDLVAKTIHDISHRKAKPFVYLDCSAIPSGLFEAELFGIEKGIATGVESRVGLLEYANGGTIFLDEIMDIPLPVQAKLLRVLQENEFEPVGSEKTIRVDIRLISTTSKDLQSAIKNKTLRDDFYYRISGVTIRIPPLRERVGDILLLARSFLQKYNAEFQKSIRGFTSDVIDALNGYSFPGNVRELDHMIRKAVLFCSSDRIDVKDIEIPQITKPRISLRDLLLLQEKNAAIEAVHAANNDYSVAAKVLSISKKKLVNILSETE